jgi:hypothetical protein
MLFGGAVYKLHRDDVAKLDAAGGGPATDMNEEELRARITECRVPTRDLDDEDTGVVAQAF